jgi:DNA invertase Pin-like site-specific DNA recombinase
MPGILVGYARTSTCDQQAGLDAQIRDLKAIGCEEVYAEQVSAVAQRDRLSEALRSSAEATRWSAVSQIALPGAP